MAPKTVFICGHREARNLLGHLSRALVREKVVAPRYFGGDVAALSSRPDLLHGNILVLGLCRASHDPDSVECVTERALLQQAAATKADVCIIPDLRGLATAPHIQELAGSVKLLVIPNRVEGIGPTDICWRSEPIYVEGKPFDQASQIATALAPYTRVYLEGAWET